MRVITDIFMKIEATAGTCRNKLEYFTNHIALGIEWMTVKKLPHIVLNLDCT